MADNKISELVSQALAKEWFYTFDLPGGHRTASYHDGELDAIHATRWRMLSQHVENVFGGNYAKLKALDLACHQGYFSLKTAQLGFASVLGIDARHSHVDDSRLMAEIYGLEQVQFQQADIFDLDAQRQGKFDLVLMLGLLYHLENPVGALRLAHTLCKGVCLIETQVVPGLSGLVDYGSYRFVRPLKGSFGIIDETADTHGPEASVTGICLVPSLEALLWTLQKVGFADVSVLKPPADAYEQLRYGKRVMVAAHV